MLMKKMMCLCSLTAFVAVMGFNVITFAGDLEPSAPPASTMKTLDEIPPTWSQKLPAADRFELVLDGEGVLDKETGLVWEQSPDPDIHTWDQAMLECTWKTVGDRRGWHLPTIEQLLSLVDPSNHSAGNPDLPLGHPFSSTVDSQVFYWSSTSLPRADHYSLRVVEFDDGRLFVSINNSPGHAWCVRGGNTHGPH